MESMNDKPEDIINNKINDMNNDVITNIRIEHICYYCIKNNTLELFMINHSKLQFIFIDNDSLLDIEKQIVIDSENKFISIGGKPNEQITPI
jgi:hypothetical protein